MACKFYYNLFLKNGLISHAKPNDYQYQYFEINKYIYTKYIQFKSIYVNMINNFLKNISNYRNTIGIHYRMSDMCFYKNEYCTNKEVEKRYYNHIKKLYKKESSIVLISTINNKIAKRISNGFKYIQYMPY